MYFYVGKKPTWAHRSVVLQTNIQLGQKCKFPTSTSVLFKKCWQCLGCKKSSHHNVVCMWKASASRIIIEAYVVCVWKALYICDGVCPVCYTHI